MRSQQFSSFPGRCIDSSCLLWFSSMLKPISRCQVGEENWGPIVLTTFTLPASQNASVTGLVVTGLVAGAVSIVVSLVLALLTFRFVRKPELEAMLRNKEKELDKAAELKKQEISDTVQSELDAERKRRELDRVEQVHLRVIACAGPMLVAVKDLLHRLDNILDDYGYGPLAADWDATKPEAWSNTHEYFMASTLYLFSRYFARVEILRDQLGADQYVPERDKDSLQNGLRSVTDALSDFPAPYNTDECPGHDTQVFAWQQTAMGEVLIQRGQDGITVSSYPAFLDAQTKAGTHLEPLRAMLLDLAPIPEGNCRWLRLATTRDALMQVRQECERILKVPETPLNNEKEG